MFHISLQNSTNSLHKDCDTLWGVKGVKQLSGGASCLASAGRVILADMTTPRHGD